MLNKFIGLLLAFLCGFVFFNSPKLTTVENINNKSVVQMPVVWIEKRDEELEYWLQNQKKK